MIEKIIEKCEEIVDKLPLGIFIQYEHDGAYSAKFTIKGKDNAQKKLGKLTYLPDTHTFLYSKYDKGTDDVFFLNWAIISKLRMVDTIEINEFIKKDTINRYSVGVRKLCQMGDFVNLQDTGFGLQILLKKDNAKCEKMKFNFSKNRFEVEK